MIIKRGQIYYCDLSSARGSEQGGLRPCIIIQNDIGNKHSPTVIVVPLTTKTTKAKLPTHIPITEGTKPSVALCEQIRTIDKSRISGTAIGWCCDNTMQKVNLALKISLGL